MKHGEAERMTWLAAFATTFGFVGSASNIFQVIKIFRRRSAKDISILTYSILFVGSIFWILYGLEIRNIPILVTNITMSILVGMVIIGWYLYGREP